jgi:hypothetical protein
MQDDVICLDEDPKDKKQGQSRQVVGSKRRHSCKATGARRAAPKAKPPDTKIACPVCLRQFRNPDEVQMHVGWCLEQKSSEEVNKHSLQSVSEFCPSSKRQPAASRASTNARAGPGAGRNTSLKRLSHGSVTAKKQVLDAAGEIPGDTRRMFEHAPAPTTAGRHISAQGGKENDDEGWVSTEPVNGSSSAHHQPGNIGEKLALKRGKRSLGLARHKVQLDAQHPQSACDPTVAKVSISTTYDKDPVKVCATSRSEGSAGRDSHGRAREGGSKYHVLPTWPGLAKEGVTQGSGSEVLYGKDDWVEEIQQDQSDADQDADHEESAIQGRDCTARLGALITGIVTPSSSMQSRICSVWLAATVTEVEGDSKSGRDIADEFRCQVSFERSQPGASWVQDVSTRDYGGPWKSEVLQEHNQPVNVGAKPGSTAHTGKFVPMSLLELVQCTGPSTSFPDTEKQPFLTG